MPVEGEDALVPARPGQPIGLLGLQAGAGGDDEHVVGERLAVEQHDLVVVGVDPGDLCAMKVDAVSQLAAARPDDLVHLRETERDEQQARLVKVAIVAVDDVDLRLVLVVAAP